MKIPISNDVLDVFPQKNTEYLVDLSLYSLPSGQAEYRLYSYLSLLFNNTTILDIGTNQGRSAIALSHNDTNRVISYNIVDQICDVNHVIYSKPNIEFRIKNVLEDLTAELVKTVHFVVIDIDHYETIEQQIMDRLQSLGFSGIIILDDTTNHPDPEIHECMNRLWNGITLKKYDLTKYGHWSGTGVVLMNTDIDFALA
jgi:predicted O-methyltransferase YrrM